MGGGPAPQGGAGPPPGPGPPEPGAAAEPPDPDPVPRAPDPRAAPPGRPGPAGPGGPQRPGASSSAPGEEAGTPSPDPHHPRAAQKVLRGRTGEWVLRHTVGQGSFAVVWRAEHRQTGQTVAVKEINTSRLGKKLLEGLAQEIAVLQKMRHPNIVRLFEIVRDPKKARIYLVLEYCAGGDLSKFVKRRGALGEAAVQHFMRQLAAGLQHIRTFNLMHRDLKPQNLLLTDAGDRPSLRIADFGFARDVKPQGIAETLCGSPLYMAPEILQYKQYDVKADLWSVGTILFELLAGRPPFTGANHLQLLHNIERSEAALPPDVAARLSEPCRDLVRRLLRKNPLERLSFEGFFSHPFIGVEPPRAAPAPRPIPVPGAAGPHPGAAPGSAGRAGSRFSSPSSEAAEADEALQHVKGALVVMPPRSRQNSLQPGGPAADPRFPDAGGGAGGGVEEEEEEEYVFINSPELEGAAGPPRDQPEGFGAGPGPPPPAGPLAAPPHPGNFAPPAAAAALGPRDAASVPVPSGFREMLGGSSEGSGSKDSEEAVAHVTQVTEADRTAIFVHSSVLVGKLAAKQENYLNALALYILSAKVIQGALALLAAEVPAEAAAGDATAAQLQHLLVQTAEEAERLAQKYHTADASEEALPDSIDLVYQYAIQTARKGAVDEMLGNHKAACSGYGQAELLLQFIMLEATGSTFGYSLSRADQIRITEYLMRLKERHTVCKAPLSQVLDNLSL